MIQPPRPPGTGAAPVGAKGEQVITPTAPYVGFKISGQATYGTIAAAGKDKDKDKEKGN